MIFLSQSGTGEVDLDIYAGAAFKRLRIIFIY